MNLYNCMMILTSVTGDDSKPWLIAVCLIVSLVMLVGLFIFGRGMKAEDKTTKKSKSKKSIDTDKKDIDNE